MRLFFSFIIFTLFLMTVPQQDAFAADDSLVCAAIYACNGRGEVMPEYASGPCGEYYARQCRAEQQEQNSEMEQAYQSCQRELSVEKTRRSDLEKKQTRLFKRARRLLRRYRQGDQ